MIYKFFKTSKEYEIWYDSSFHAAISLYCQQHPNSFIESEDGMEPAPEYMAAYNAIMSPVVDVVPVYPPDEIERIHAEQVKGFRWVHEALLNSGESPESIKSEASAAMHNIQEERKKAYLLWEQYGR